MSARMLAGFALYREQSLRPDQCTIGMPIGSRAMQLIRLPNGWRLWLATKDFVYGTYIELFSDGRIMHMTTRCNEGDEYFWARPSDEDIRLGRR